MTLEDLKNLVTILGIFGTVGVFIKGIFEFSRQNAMRRLELFQSMRKRFEESPSIKRVRDALESDGKDAFATLTKNDKVDFLAFYEDLALMVDTRMMRFDIAQYWFSFYVIMANDEDAFWVGLDPNLPYWKVVRQFAAKMKLAEANLAGQTQKTFRL